MKFVESDLTELRSKGERLSARLGQSAEDMKTNGICPSGTLLSELASYSDAFNDLCRRLYEKSPAWRARTFHSLVDLEDAFSSEQSISQALEVVQSVAKLQHTDDPNHPGISQLRQEVQQVLRNLEGRDSGTDRQAEELLAGRHPLNSLLKLVTWGDTLNDEQWVRLQDTVTETFGRELAIAVARGKIITTEPSAVTNRLSNIESTRS